SVSANPIEGPVFRVSQLSGGNLLLNAEGGPGGVGAILVPDVGADGMLAPNESVTAVFVVGLQVRRSFTFFVDVLGSVEQEARDVSLPTNDKSRLHPSPGSGAL